MLGYRSLHLCDVLFVSTEAQLAYMHVYQMLDYKGVHSFGVLVLSASCMSSACWAAKVCFTRDVLTVLVE